MFKLGLKLWSTNDSYIEEAQKLYNEGFYDFIELFVKPGSYEGYSYKWKKLNIPFIIHAPHWFDGVNLAKPEAEAGNIEMIGQARKFADKLNADKIILHSGTEGDIKETARQIATMNDGRYLIENKPYEGIGGKIICNGSTPEEIKYIIDRTGIGFCLDIGHAICAANSHKQEISSYIKQFLVLNPYMFHLSDGIKDEVYDDHKHFGDGNYDINGIVRVLPKNAIITIETEKQFKNSLDDFKKDVEVIRGYYDGK